MEINIEYPKSRKIFCSPICFLKKYPQGIKICRCCSKKFQVKYHNSSQSFCSEKCRKKLRKKIIKCPNCNKEYSVPNHQPKKFCSNKCANIYNGRRSRIARGEVPYKRKKDLTQNIKLKHIDMNNIDKTTISSKKRPNLSKKMKNNTWTLRWFIDKYGLDIGQQKYVERSEQIKKTTHFKVLNKKSRNNYSNISQELFREVLGQIKDNYQKIYFAELNHEYSCGTPTNFDFVVVDNKKVIEFNGDKFHANPNMFKENDFPNPFNKKLSSKDIWLIDEHKIKSAINNGYEVIVVWESDYIKNKKNCVKQCIDFVRNGKL